MAELPKATTTIDDEAGGFAGASGYCVVMAAVGKNDDITPRVFSSVKNLLTQHDYSKGASYVAHHIQDTKKPVIFVGLPIATPGTIGRQNSTGVTGSSTISVSGGPYGPLDEVDGVVTVITGGTVGTNGILIEFSADGGRNTKRQRLGTSTSYTPPHLGIVINFGGGTLNAGDVYTFTTTEPMWDSDGLTAARTALANQLKLARSWMVIGELANSTFAGYVTTQANAYETENERFVFARASVRDRLPLASMAQITKRIAGLTLTFAEVGGTGDTITRSTGSFITDGLVVGDTITVSGSVSNNVTGAIASLTATVITLGTTDLAAEGPVADCVITASPTLTFAEVGGTGDTLTRSSGSWLADGFRSGDTVTVTGTASNNVSGAIASLTATVVTFGSTDLAAEVIRSDAVTITAGETMAAWVSSIDAAFATVDDQPRIDLAAGRARKQCPITGWAIRRAASWPTSIREYQRPIQNTTWAKEDGVLKDWSIDDGNGIVEEYDERTDGGLLAARFTCLRTWGNGPEGAFVAMSLTRAVESSLLSLTHNMAVTNLTCTVVQSETEMFVGKTIPLKSGGLAEEAALVKLEGRVNSALERELLQDKGEGPKASKAVWTASRFDVLNVPNAELTGEAELLLNGTIVKVSTRVRVKTGG